MPTNNLALLQVGPVHAARRVGTAPVRSGSIAIAGMGNLRIKGAG